MVQDTALYGHKMETASASAITIVGSWDMISGNLISKKTR